MTSRGKLGSEVDEILQKYEVPYQYGMALWDAYEAGAKEGFKRALDAGIQTINDLKLTPTPPKQEVDTNV